MRGLAPWLAAVLVLTACASGAGTSSVARDTGMHAGRLPDATADVSDAAGVAAPRVPTAPDLVDLVDLVTPDGAPFELSSLRGHPALIFFGYTHCPDVCPTTLGELLEVLEARPEARAVFVSIDPERDTAGFLGQWARYLPAGFIALTGSPGAVRRAADGFDVRYARVETTSTAGYSMSHSADVFLVDAEGRLQRTYPFGTNAQTMVTDLARQTSG